MARTLIAKSNPIRVAFLLLYIEAWDALAEIYALMRADARFDAQVFVLPRKLTGDSEFGGTLVASRALEELGVPHVVVPTDNPAIGLGMIRDFAPDYSFINYPWQRNYQPEYRVDSLIRLTRVCYVPYYFLPLINEPGETGVAPHIYTQRSHQLASLVFTQDANVVDAYAGTERGNSFVHFVGSPKIDAMVAQGQTVAEWPIETGGDNTGSVGAQTKPYRIIWAPHHTFEATWCNFGMFTTMYQDVLEFAKTRSDVEIVLRPHPFMFGTLVELGLLTAAQIREWRHEFEALPNTYIDQGGSYLGLFKAADLMITDGISFLGEYPLVTGKPTVFIEKAEHWGFSPIGQIAAAANVRFASFDDFVEAFDEIKTHGLSDRSVEIAALRQAACPNPGESAKQIVEIVAADSAEGTGLVDALMVKQLSWEAKADLRRLEAARNID